MRRPLKAVRQKIGKPSLCLKYLSRHSAPLTSIHTYAPGYTGPGYIGAAAPTLRRRTRHKTAPGLTEMRFR